MSYSQCIAEIVKNIAITEDVFDMIVSVGDFAAACKAGQFVNIRCEGKTLRRPISICEINVAEGTIRLVYQVKGEGTLWMSQLKTGDSIDILGPLGNGFDLSDYPGRVMVIGGGIGVPPMLQTSKLADECTAVLGFRSKSNVILQSDFEKSCEKVFITTDDGSYGEHGFVTDVIKRELAENDYSVVCACGPKAMLKNVAAAASDAGVECLVSLEERMACGIGACLVCACRINGENGSKMGHVCKDGPVFKASEVDFNG